MSRFSAISSLVLSAVILLTAGCHVLSEEARRSVSPEASFAEIRSKPEAHRGESLILGGLIVGHRVSDEGSTLEILRWRLDSRGEPVAVDEDASRFLLKSVAPLDPAVFQAGRLVTLVGTATGAETHRLDQNDYRYPVFRLEEIHLWETPFRYGIHRSPNIYAPTYVEPAGRTNPYDPGYYTYPYTPYWLRQQVR